MVLLSSIDVSVIERVHTLGGLHTMWLTVWHIAQFVVSTRVQYDAESSDTMQPTADCDYVLGTSWNLALRYRISAISLICVWCFLAIPRRVAVNMIHLSTLNTSGYISLFLPLHPTLPWPAFSAYSEPARNPRASFRTCPLLDIQFRDIPHLGAHLEPDETDTSLRADDLRPVATLTHLLPFSLAF